jgi:RimJ/RimL family protein N-acetyltransferase
MDIKEKSAIPGLEVRYTIPDDSAYLKSWFLESEMREAFPMLDEIEIDDATLRWISFCRYNCSLTMLKDGIPCGIATLYLQPYRRISHQCEFGIILGSSYQNQGIGSYLLNCLITLAKERFHIELLHLSVFEKIPAVKFYRNHGFVEFGRQEKWMKNPEGDFRTRLFMEKFL